MAVANGGTAASTARASRREPALGVVRRIHLADPASVERFQPMIEGGIGTPFGRNALTCVAAHPSGGAGESEHSAQDLGSALTRRALAATFLGAAWPFSCRRYRGGLAPQGGHPRIRQGGRTPRRTVDEEAQAAEPGPACATRGPATPPQPTNPPHDAGVAWSPFATRDDTGKTKIFDWLVP